MIASHQKGDVERARRLNALLLDSYAFETGPAAVNPVPAKAMLRTLGWPVGECRPPMGPTPDGPRGPGPPGDGRAGSRPGHLTQPRRAGRSAHRRRRPAPEHHGHHGERPGGTVGAACRFR